MARMRTLLAAAGLAAAALAVPAAASAAPVHTATASAGFTGFGSGQFGFSALAAARTDAKAQIAAAGLDLIQNQCHENYNIVEFNDFARIWQAESIWECQV
jgi:hypothetical protein